MREAKMHDMKTRAVRRFIAGSLFAATVLFGAAPASADSCHSSCPGGQNGGYARGWPGSGGIGLGGHDIAGYTGEGGGAGRYGGGGYGIAGEGGCGGNVNMFGLHVNGSACP